MAQVLNLSGFTFGVEELRAVKELLFDKVVEAPELEVMHTIYPNIVYDKEVGFVTGGALVGIAASGCGQEAQSYSVGTRKVVWEPKPWIIFIEQCATELEATAALYSLKTGIDYNDFEASDYMAIVLEQLVKDVKSFAIRIVWFADTDAEVAVVTEYPTAAVSNQSEDVPESTLSTQPAVGQPIIGTVYEGNATKNATYTIKTALHAGTVVYLKAAAATGNVVDGVSYYEKSATETVNVLVNTLVGTVYAGVSEGTPSAVTCALANKNIVYLDGSASTGTPNPAYTYYTKDTVNTTSVTTGGALKPATPAAYFTLINGLFKQMLAQVVINPGQLVNITENEAATFTGQVISKENIQGYLEQLVFNAPMELRADPKGFIPCTQSFYDAYRKSLNGTSISEMYTNIIEGVKVLTYDGIPLMPIPTWDNIIKAYYNDGERYTFGPNIAVYTTKEVLAVGVDNINSLGDLRTWYDENTELVKTKSKGKIDAKLANPALFQIAI